MRGSIRELRPGYWQVRFYVDRDPLTGRSRYISRGVAGKRRDAERLANQLAATITKQRHRSGVHTMAELWDDWLAHLAAIGRSPTTLRGYRQKLDVMAPYLGHHQVAAVTPKMIDSLYQRLLTRTYRDRPATPSLVASFHRVLSSSLAQRCAGG